MIPPRREDFSPLSRQKLSLCCPCLSIFPLSRYLRLLATRQVQVQGSLNGRLLEPLLLASGRGREEIWGDERVGLSIVQSREAQVSALRSSQTDGIPSKEATLFACGQLFFL